MEKISESTKLPPLHGGNEEAKSKAEAYFMEAQLLKIFADVLIANIFENEDCDDIRKPDIRFAVLSKLRPKHRTTDEYIMFLDWCKDNKIDTGFLIYK